MLLLVPAVGIIIIIILNVMSLYNVKSLDNPKFSLPLVSYLTKLFEIGESSDLVPRLQR